jgi:phosphatidylinositol-3-phosphatase
VPHTVLIVLENHEFEEVIGNPKAPFLNELSRSGALASRYHAITHPSLPNYLAILGGSTFGIASNCTECVASGPSLAEQLSRTDISWRAYMEGLPYPCFAGAQEGKYVKRHNPFMYFDAIASVPSRCRNVVPETRLHADLRRRSLPAFAWLSPDLCNDAHSCGIDAADRAMAKLVPRLRRQLGPGGVLIVTFDEGSSSAGCCAVAAGGRVLTILVGPGIPRRTRLDDLYTHYSLLAAIEDRYGLRRIRHARSARPLPLSFGQASLK